MLARRRVGACVAYAAFGLLASTADAQVLVAKPADALGSSSASSVKRVRIALGNQYLIVEALSDDLVHFELSALGPGPDPSLPVYSSPMVADRNHSGPTGWSDATVGNMRTMGTPDTKVDVDITSLCARSHG